MAKKDKPINIVNFQQFHSNRKIEDAIAEVSKEAQKEGSHAVLEVIEEGNIEKSMKEIERHYLSTGKKLYGNNLPEYLEAY